MENIKDAAARQELVDKIITNGLKEIHERRIRLKEDMDELDIFDRANEEDFNLIVEELMALIYLEEYLKRKDVMMGYTSMIGDDVVYIIPLENLEIWLAEGVLSKYLTYLELSSKFPSPLVDEDFGYRHGFVTILEKIIHERRVEGKI